MRRIILITNLIASLLLTSIFLYGQGVKATAKLDSTMILIGDQVHLRLDVEYPADSKVNFPNPADSLAQSVEIVERVPATITDGNNSRKVWSQEYIVTSFDSGMHVIPPFIITVNNNGSVDSIKSNALLLQVFTLPKLDSLMNALKGPIDIKKPYEAPIIFKEIAPWLMGILLVAGLIFLIFYALKRRKTNQPLFFIPQKPKEPAHIIALRELDKIKEEQLWQQGNTKLYYSEITDVLREYIMNRFGISAMEQTSEEIIKSFAKDKSLLNEKTFENLKRILFNADLVKFAKYEPLPDENNLALVDSYFFVNNTKVVEIVEEKAPEDNNDGNVVDIK